MRSAFGLDASKGAIPPRLQDSLGKLPVGSFDHAHKEQALLFQRQQSLHSGKRAVCDDRSPRAKVALAETKDARRPCAVLCVKPLFVLARGALDDVDFENDFCRGTCDGFEFRADTLRLTLDFCNVRHSVVFVLSVAAFPNRHALVDR